MGVVRDRFWCLSLPRQRAYVRRLMLRRQRVTWNMRRSVRSRSGLLRRLRLMWRLGMVLLDHARPGVLEVLLRRW